MEYYVQSKRKSKPRVGSSASRRTRYYGFKKFNRDYDELERALLKLVQTGRANQRKLQKYQGRICGCEGIRKCGGNTLLWELECI